MTQRIAIIEDEQEVSNRFAEWLRASSVDSLKIDQWFTRDDGERAIQDTAYDLIVMDVMFGHDRFAGIGMIEAINKKPGAPTPVLVVTGLESESYKALIKELGVFEFLQKPVQSHDFVQTVREILRQKKLAAASVAEVPKPAERLFLDPLQGEPKWDNQPFKLALSGQRLLSAIYKARPNVVTYDELFKVVITGATKENVRKHIAGVREAIESVDPSFDSIKTDPNKGFRWVE